MSMSSATNTNESIQAFLSCFENVTDDKFIENMTHSIENLGRNTFLSILGSGLHSVTADTDTDTDTDIVAEPNNNISNACSTLSRIQTLTAELELRAKEEEPTDLHAIASNCWKVFNADTIFKLCSFLCIADQVAFKRTCATFNAQMAVVDIRSHSTIAFRYDLAMVELKDIFKSVNTEVPFNFFDRESLCSFHYIHNNSFEFDEIRICGETQLDNDDVRPEGLYAALGIDLELLRQLTAADDSPPRTRAQCQQRTSVFFEQLDVWFYIMAHYCADKTGTVVFPKMEIRSGLGFCLRELNVCLVSCQEENKKMAKKRRIIRKKNKKRRRQNKEKIEMDVGIAIENKLRIPRCFILRCHDNDCGGGGFDADRIGFVLEQICVLFDPLREIFALNKNVQEIIIVPATYAADSLRTVDVDVLSIFQKESRDVFGAAFVGGNGNGNGNGNQQESTAFVTLKKSERFNNQYAIYLTFTEKLIQAFDEQQAAESESD